MKKNLLLVDYENIQKIDLSLLDDSYRAIIFVGAKQNPPKASRGKSTAHRFTRVDFHKIEGSGKNASDFHIAFQLGRTIETEPETECFVLSKDKGFDPLLSHLNKNGLKCTRIESVDEIVSEQAPVIHAAAEVVCGRCHKASTIEHHGGRWCSNCGRFATEPDPKLLPSNQPDYVARPAVRPVRYVGASTGYVGSSVRPGYPVCCCCNQRIEVSDGIYDDGEWTCWGCLGVHD